MALRSVNVVGGGPSGLFVARLLRQRHPEARVVVYEQHGLDRTFGFGVGLATAAQHQLARVDPQVHDAVLAASHGGAGMTMKLPSGTASVQADGAIGIERLVLLRELTRLARDVGVEVRYGRRREPNDLAADLVVAADGVGSSSRQLLHEQIGSSVDLGRSLYLWCGAKFALDHAVFEPISTQHGVFTMHAYPYAVDKSTFLFETDEQTWRKAGFEASTNITPMDQSDQQSLVYLTNLFQDALGGHSLIGNRTRWTRFRTVSCRRWFHGNVVLIGDAAHTAHYSIGSGTKLAMEDAIALAEAIDDHDSVPEALEAYDVLRRPKVESLQLAARRSQTWWDSFPDRMRLPPATVLASFMTRTGRVDLNRLHALAPDTVRSAIHAYAGDIPSADDDMIAWVLHRPLSRGSLRTSQRIIRHNDLRGRRVARLHVRLDSAWGAEADTLLAKGTEESSTSEVLWLSGPNDVAAVATRIEFAERLKRADAGAAVLVEVGDSATSVVASALVADQIDLASLSD